MVTVIRPTNRLRRCLGAALLAVLGLCLGWQVANKSFGSFLSETAPLVALRFNSSDPQALLLAAETTLNESALAALAALQREHDESGDTSSSRPNGGGETDPVTLSRRAGEAVQRRLAELAGKGGPTGVVEQLTISLAEANRDARGMAETAIANDPFNARGLRLLGQMADNAGEMERAGALMSAAAHRSLREGVAAYWLMQQSFTRREFVKGLEFADSLLRSNPALLPVLSPTLAQVATDAEGINALKVLLETNPPWRSQFLTAMTTTVSDPRTLLDVMLSLKDSTAPPTKSDVGGFLRFLISNNLDELAYYSWLQFLPPDQLSVAGLLFNGGFEMVPSGLPFDWVFSPGGGVTIDRSLRKDREREHGLFIEFGYGRVDFRSVKQMTMLPPGTYRLSGQYLSQISAKRGLVWRVTCDRDRTLGETPMILGVSRTWKEFSALITVPDSGCRSQTVRLDHDARSASEQLITGSVWFDDIQIVRVAINE